MKRDIEDVKKDKANEDALVRTRDEAAATLAKKEGLLAVGDISFYLESLSEIAKKTGVRIISVRPVKLAARPFGEPKSPEIYRPAYFEISARSGFHEMGQFVERIENYPTFIRVNRVSASGNPERITEHDVFVDITMLTKSLEPKK